MAKSIRSKWKRARRAEKREKNSVRELARLKRITAAFATDQLVDAQMVAVEKPPLYNVPSGAALGQDVEKNPEAMESSEKRRDPKTLRDENGQYPAWMNQRTIRQRKVAAKKTKKAAKGKKKKNTW